MVVNYLEKIQHLKISGRGLACACGNPIPRLNPPCLRCQGMTCALCDRCTTYRRGGDHGWIEPGIVDQPLRELLKRLRSGQKWIQEKDEQEYIGELFGKTLAVWDEIEIVVRHLHEFRECIHGDDASCPEDAPVRCCACAPISAEHVGWRRQSAGQRPRIHLKTPRSSNSLYRGSPERA